jgi:predicted nuclease of predicted toxin-antitoxin system
LKFLVDNALSPQVAVKLRLAGHDAVHLRDFNKQSASDIEVFELAVKEDRILISADTDFGTLLATRRTKKPSLVLFRRSLRHPDNQASFLLSNLPNMEQPLKEGSVIILEDSRIRIRSLPIGGEENKPDQVASRDE